MFSTNEANRWKLSTIIQNDLNVKKNLSDMWHNENGCHASVELFSVFISYILMLSYNCSRDENSQSLIEIFKTSAEHFAFFMQEWSISNVQVFLKLRACLVHIFYFHSTRNRKSVYTTLHFVTKVNDLFFFSVF